MICLPGNNGIAGCSPYACIYILRWMSHGFNIQILIVAAIAMAVVWSSVSEASFFGPSARAQAPLFANCFELPALPPFGHTRFCLRYPDECSVHGIDFRRRNIALTAARWDELNPSTVKLIMTSFHRYVGQRHI